MAAWKEGRGVHSGRRVPQGLPSHPQRALLTDVPGNQEARRNDLLNSARSIFA